MLPALLLAALLGACGSDGGSGAADVSDGGTDGVLDVPSPVDAGGDPNDAGFDRGGDGDVEADPDDAGRDSAADGDAPEADSADDTAADLPGEDALGDTAVDSEGDVLADADATPDADAAPDTDAAADTDTADVDGDAVDATGDGDATSAEDAPPDVLSDLFADSADTAEDALDAGGDGLDLLDDVAGDADALDDAAGDADALDDGGTDVLGDADLVEDAPSDAADAETDLGLPCEYPEGWDDGRYAEMAELQDDELIAALHDLIDDHNGLSYDTARDYMYISDQIDVAEDGFIECLYTGIRIEADGTRSPDGAGTQITTEHSWPRSEGAASFPAEGDIHHLFPTIEEANNRRSSHDFGYVACGETGEPTCPYAQGGSRLGPSEEDGSTVFEVRPVGRGDIARAHFYFSVRYELAIGADEEAVLREWHCADPPDDVERARNDAIEVRQNNRNPFVDQPAWVEHIADF